MESSFKRELGRNYMVMTPKDETDGGYEGRMLLSNSIPGILKFRLKQTDNRPMFFYDITSKQPLRRMMEKRYVNAEEIRRLLIQISSVQRALEGYLIPEDRILLNPDHIYVDPDTFAVSLCVVPAYEGNFSDAFTGLLQYLMEKVDHKDKDSVVMAYRLYHESLKENYGVDRLMRVLGELRAGAAEEEQAENADKDGALEDLWGRQEPMPENEWEENSGWKEEEENRGLEPIMESGGKGKKIPWKLCVFCYLSFAAGSPLGVWLLKGTGGLMRYGIYLLALDGALLVMGIGWRLMERRRNGQTKSQKSQKKMDQTAEPGTKERRERRGRKQEIPESWRVMLEDEPGTETEAAPEKRAAEPRAMITEVLADFTEDASDVYLIQERSGEKIVISYVPFIIGKSRDMSDGCVDHATVSRLHVRIDCREGVYILTDLNSTNGTTVDGYKLEANETVSLKHGDQVVLADLVFRFVERDGN